MRSLILNSNHSECRNYYSSIKGMQVDNHTFGIIIKKLGNPGKKEGKYETEKCIADRCSGNDIGGDI